MLGLIEKDLRLTLSRKQTLVMFFIMALVMGISMEGSFIVGYLTMLATIISIATLSYDEFDNGFRFLMTLPFDRKTYVREKYLFSFMMAAAAWCIGAVLYCIGSMIRHNGTDFFGELPMLIAIIPVVYLSASFLIPLQLKYGAERSRTVLFIIFGIIAVLIFGARTIFNRLPLPGELVKRLDGMPPVTILLILTAICAAITCICYLWSIVIIEKKEF